MPTYVYECRDCGEGFEIEQRISEDPLTECRSCEDGTIRRIMQPTAVMFKGSGFYVNDKSSTNPAQESTDKKSDSEPEAKPDTKEAVPAAAEPASESKSDA